MLPERLQSPIRDSCCPKHVLVSPEAAAEELQPVRPLGLGFLDPVPPETELLGAGAPLSEGDAARRPPGLARPPRSSAESRCWDRVGGSQPLGWA